MKKSSQEESGRGWRGEGEREGMVNSEEVGSQIWAPTSTNEGFDQAGELRPPGTFAQLCSSRLKPVADMTREVGFNYLVESIQQ